MPIKGVRGREQREAHRINTKPISSKITPALASNRKADHSARWGDVRNAADLSLGCSEREQVSPGLFAAVNNSSTLNFIFFPCQLLPSPRRVAFAISFLSSCFPMACFPTSLSRAPPKTVRRSSHTCVEPVNGTNCLSLLISKPAKANFFVNGAKNHHPGSQGHWGRHRERQQPGMALAPAHSIFHADARRHWGVARDWREETRERDLATATSRPPVQSLDPMQGSVLGPRLTNG